jgi:hypothetical protein
MLSFQNKSGTMDGVRRMAAQNASPGGKLAQKMVIQNHFL